MDVICFCCTYCEAWRQRVTWDIGSWISESCFVARISLPSSYVDYKVNIYKEGTLLLLNFPFVSFPHLCTQFQWTSPKVETNLNKEIHSRAYVIGWGNFWVESPQALLMQIAWTNKRENSQGDKTASVNKKRETLPVLWSNKYP